MREKDNRLDKVLSKYCHNSDCQNKCSYQRNEINENEGGGGVACMRTIGNKLRFLIRRL